MCSQNVDFRLEYYMQLTRVSAEPGKKRPGKILIQDEISNQSKKIKASSGNKEALSHGVHPNKDVQVDGIAILEL